MFTTSPRVDRLQALIQADSFNQSAHYLLGQEYLAQGRYMEAAAKFRRVIELNPEHGDGWMLMGDAYDKVGVAKEAVAAYTTAITVFRRLKNSAKATVAQSALERVNTSVAAS